MTLAPAATADSQPSEEQAVSRKRSRTTITPTASQYTAEKSRRSNKANEEDKICPPGPKTEKTGEDKEQKQYPRCKYAKWEDVGSVEYNPETTKWECRFEHCQHEMLTERLTHYHRNKLHPEHSIGIQDRDNMSVL